jgi:peptide subunit release factor 1 (eRF1)
MPRPREWDSGDGVRRDGVKAMAETVMGHERDDERRVIDTVVGQALRGGLAVLGPEDVVLAVNEGRVHELVIEEDFQRAGWRCDNCDALGARAEAVEVCPFCAGDVRVVKALGEALVARTLAGGGRIEVVPHERKLHSYRGVAAFLRQTSPTGLAGGSSPWPTAPGANRG